MQAVVERLVGSLQAVVDRLVGSLQAVERDWSVVFRLLLRETGW